MKINFLAKPYTWALDFDRFVKRKLESRDDAALIDYTKQRSASSAHPTYDHYLPLLYVIGASENETPQFLNGSIFAGSISMRCAVIGANRRL